MRKKIITALLLTLFVFPIGNFTDYSNNIVFAEKQLVETGINPNEKDKRPPASVDFSTGNYKLINDKTETLKEEEIKGITEELNLIYEKGAKHNESVFRMFAFIYDSPSKSIKEAEAEVLSNNTLSDNIEPVIFIYNKANKEYKYIIDETIQNYISLPYLQDVTTKTIINKGFNKDSLEEMLIRTNSTISMALSGEFATQNKAGEVYEKNRFSIRDITKENNDSNTTENKEDKSSKKETTKQDESESNYSLIAILLAFASILIVFYKKKKKKDNK